MASAATALWQPQEEGLREICALLEAHISPNSDQARIWQKLQHYGQFPDFNNYLVFLLARGEGKPFEVRQAAGLLLKNNLRAAFISMPPASQQYIKSELLPCIGATNRAIRSTVGQLSVYFSKLFDSLDGSSCFRLYINVLTVMIWIIWKVVWMLSTSCVKTELQKAGQVRGDMVEQLSEPNDL